MPFPATGRALPGYWTPQEIADELGKSPKWVLHKITGRYGRAPELMAYEVSRLYFIPNREAESFLRRYGGEYST